MSAAHAAVCYLLNSIAGTATSSMEALPIPLIFIISRHRKPASQHRCGSSSSNRQSQPTIPTSVYRPPMQPPTLQPQTTKCCPAPLHSAWQPTHLRQLPHPSHEPVEGSPLFVSLPAVYMFIQCSVCVPVIGLCGALQMWRSVACLWFCHCLYVLSYGPVNGRCATVKIVVGPHIG